VSRVRPQLLAFIVSGRIVRTDSVRRLLEPVERKHAVRVSFSKAPGDLTRGFSESFPELRAEFTGDGALRVESDEPVRVGPLIRFLEDRGAEVVEARRVRPPLEDVFVEITVFEADSMRREKEKKGGGP